MSLDAASRVGLDREKPGQELQALGAAAAGAAGALAAGSANASTQLELCQQGVAPALGNGYTGERSEPVPGKLSQDGDLGQDGAAPLLTVGCKALGASLQQRRTFYGKK